MTPRRILALLLAALLPSLAPAQNDPAAWQALKSGNHVALIRHALAPGTGDPPGFRLDDPSTQRNLSAVGRSQATAIGRDFRERTIPVSAIFTSQWSRCRETAELLGLGLGPVTPQPALNSFFADRSTEPAQTEATLDLIRTHLRPDASLVIVTHQVNITALIGIIPASGEILVARPEANRLIVVGRIPPPD